MIAIYRHLIEWGDCDPAGIVFNPRYFEWFDAATANIFRQGGIGKGELVRRFGIVIPVVETKATFRRPSKWGEEIRIESVVADFGRSSFKIEHVAKDSDGETCVIGNEARVCASYDPDDKSKLKSAPIPPDVADLFRRYAKDGSAAEG